MFEIKGCGRVLGLAGLLLVAAGAGARADETLKLRLVLELGILTKTYEITDSGLGDAKEQLKSWYGDTKAEALETWRFLGILGNLRVRKLMASAASISGQDTYPIHVDLLDQAVDKGSGVWPHVSKKTGQNEVYLGETGMKGTSTARLLITLLHEFGHMGDGSSCKSLGYGPNQSHRIEEIIAPSGAFAEGFGHYVSYRDFTPDEVANLGKQDAYVLRKYRRITDRSQGDDMFIERDDKTEEKILPRDLKLWDFVCNESFVAGVLMDIHDLKSKDGTPVGRTLIEAGIRLSQGQGCRHLGHFLKLCVAGAQVLVPEGKQMIKEILDIRSMQVASDAEIELLLEGKLAPGMKSHEVPRDRNYYPTEDGTEMIPPQGGIQPATFAAESSWGSFGF